MNRAVLISSMVTLAMLNAAGESTVSTTVQTTPRGAATHADSSSLAALQAAAPQDPKDPGFLDRLIETSTQVQRLIERNELRTADEFFRAAKLVQRADVGFRNARVSYELTLSAAALGHADARKLLAAKWDELLHSLGRPLRTDVTGLAAKNPKFYSFSAAPACIQAVFRDPENARESAKSSQNNAEVQRIVDADQAARRVDWSKLSQEQLKTIGEEDWARSRRMREIIDAGELRTAADFRSAALVMQHSSHFEGYQLAHELSVCGMLLGHDRARWLAAASYDRMLGSVGHEQRFGTQYRHRGGKTVLKPVDAQGICDAERVAVGCPTLEQAMNRDMLGGKKATSIPPDVVIEGKVLRDTKYGVESALPAGWTVSQVTRWGDQQVTWTLEAGGHPQANASLYYRIHHTPKPVAESDLEAYGKTQAEKKEASRRESVREYTNRPASLKTLTLGQHRAVSWIADFPGPGGEKNAELFIRIPAAYADLMLFVSGPRDQVEALRPTAEEFAASVKLP